MTITTEEFLSAFHSLNGTTIGEKRKNLFLLLKKIQDPQNIDLSSIQPRTRLEESFQVEVLIHFKKVPELVEVLKTENPILIEKVLKASSWLLNEALEIINGEDLVNHIFPSLSFNAKVKVLNKLACYLKNNEKADAIFNAVKEKYGFYLAAKLLPCCSGQIITDCIKLSKIELTPRQLLMIIKTHPQLTESIFQILAQFDEKSIIQNKYQNVFAYILQNDLLLFLKLHKDFKPCFHLGWRATDRLVIRNKRDIIKNADLFYKLLHKKQIIKSVTTAKDFNEFYLNLLPKSLEGLKNDYNFYLKLIPSNKIDVLITSFKQKYGDDLWDDPECITPGFLELMTVEEREVWMLTHERPKHLSEDLWICLMKTDKSITALKKRISSISKIKERAELIGCLVETCRINNDKGALLEVCKYMVMQHRNDDTAVLLSFLNSLQKCFCLNNLEDEHWKFIIEMAEIIMSKRVIPYYYFRWFSDYIGYRLAKGLSIKKELKELASKSDLLGNAYPNLEHQKRYLLELAELEPDILYGNDKTNNHRFLFLSILLKWNRKHPKNQVPPGVYKNLIGNVIEVMKTERNDFQFSYMINVVLVDYIPMRIDQNEKIAMLDVCYTKENIGVEMNIMEWLIKYEPWLILRYIDSFINKILDLWYTLIKPFFWKHCKNYSHLEIPQKIIAICLQVINNKEENESRKKNAITALSHLMFPEDFLNLIEPYYPSDLIMDVNNEENQETYKIQQAITASLKNVIPPSCTLQSVLNFSKGDYLKFIQRSLSSVSLNVAEEKLPVLLLALTDRAVSVRKHAVYQTLKVMGKSEIFKMLGKFENEKNSSIRKFLFKGIFGYFSKNPNDYLWDLVKENVKYVDINDEEAFTTLMEIKKVSPVYLPQYLTFTWELLETLPNPEKFLTGKCQLLDSISASVIPSLGKEFCLGIIQKYLFKSMVVTDFQTKIFSFTWKFVLFSSSDQEERLIIIFEFIKNYINGTWYTLESKSNGRIFIYSFLKEFCAFFQEKKCLDRNILVRFLELWNNFLKPHEAFEEYLYLQFTLIYVDHNNLVQVGEKLARLCDSLSSNYGDAVTNIFCNSLNSQVEIFLSTNDESLETNRFILIESIITASNSTNCFIMAISLLPQDVPVTPKLKKIYNRIISLFENNSDCVVQLSLSLYFRNISNRIIVDIPEKGFKQKDSGRSKGFFGNCMVYECKYRN